MADIVKKVAAERQELLENNKGVTGSSRSALSAISGQNILKTKKETERMRRDREIAQGQMDAVIAKNDAAGAVTMAKAETSDAVQLDRTRRNELLLMVNIGIYEDSFAEELGMPAATVKAFADKRASEIAGRKAAKAATAKAKADYEQSLAEIREVQARKTAAENSNYRLLSEEDKKKISDEVTKGTKDETATKEGVLKAAAAVEPAKGFIYKDPFGKEQVLSLNDGWVPGSPVDREQAIRNDIQRFEEESKQAAAYYDKLLAESVRKKQAAGEALSKLESDFANTTEGLLTISKLGVKAAETPEEYAAAYEAYADDLDTATMSAFSKITAALAGVSASMDKVEKLTEEQKTGLSAAVSELQAVRRVLTQELKTEDLSVDMQDTVNEIIAEIDKTLESAEYAKDYGENFDVYKEGLHLQRMEREYGDKTDEEIRAEIDRFKAGRLDARIVKGYMRGIKVAPSEKPYSDKIKELEEYLALREQEEQAESGLTWYEGYEYLHLTEATDRLLESFYGEKKREREEYIDIVAMLDPNSEEGIVARRELSENQREIESSSPYSEAARDVTAYYVRNVVRFNEGYFTEEELDRYSAEQAEVLEEEMWEVGKGHEQDSYGKINSERFDRLTVTYGNGRGEIFRGDYRDFAKDVADFAAGSYGDFTEEEGKRVLALMNRVGDDAAFDYYAAVREEALHRKAEGLNGFTRTVAGLTSGPVNFIANGGRMLRNAFTGSYARVGGNIFTASHQVNMEKISEMGFGEEAVELLYMTGYGFFDMVPQIAISAVPVVGKPMAAAYLFSKVLATTYNESVREGMRADEALTYGFLSAASEVTMQRLIGGVTKLAGKGSVDSVLKGAIDKLSATEGVKRTLSVLSSMGLEGVEEGLQEVVSPYLKKMASELNGIDADLEEIDWEEAGKSFLIGAVLGGLFDGVEVISNRKNNGIKMADAMYTLANGNVGEIVEAAAAFGNKKALQVKEAYKAGTPLYEGQEGWNAYVSPNDVLEMRQSVKRKAARTGMRIVEDLIANEKSFDKEFAANARRIFKKMLYGRTLTEAEAAVILNDERMVKIFNRLMGLNVTALTPAEVVAMSKLAAFTEDGKISQARLKLFRDVFGEIDMKTLTEIAKYDAIAEKKHSGIVFDGAEQTFEGDAKEAADVLKILSEETGVVFYITEQFETGTFLAANLMAIKPDELNRGIFATIGKRAYEMTKLLLAERGVDFKAALLTELKQLKGNEAVETEIDRVLQQAAVTGHEFSREAAEDEVCARFMSVLMLNGRSLDRLAETDPEMANTLRKSLQAVQEHLLEETTLRIFGNPAIEKATFGRYNITKNENLTKGTIGNVDRRRNVLLVQQVGEKDSEGSRREGIEETPGTSGIFGATEYESRWGVKGGSSEGVGNDREGGESSYDSEGRRIKSGLNAALKESKVRNDAGELVAVYHFTPDMYFFVFAEGDVGFHFGTLEQAFKTGEDVQGAKEGRIFRAYLNIKNPLHIPMDFGDWNINGGLTRYLFEKGVITQQEYDELKTLDDAWANSPEYTQPGYNSPQSNRFREIMREHGYDGISYENSQEGDGTSYIAFYDEQIIKTDLSTYETVPGGIDREFAKSIFNDSENIAARLEALIKEKRRETLGYGATEAPSLDGAADRMREAVQRDIERYCEEHGITETEREWAETTANMGFSITQRPAEERMEVVGELVRRFERRGEQEIPLFHEDLPPKAKRYVNRAKNYMLATLGVSKDARKGSWLGEIADRFVKAYFENGRVDEVVFELLNGAVDEYISEDTVLQAIETFKKRLHEAERYALEDVNLRRKTQGAVTMSEVNRAYGKIRTARKKAERVRGQYLLTKEDETILGRLHRGDLTPDRVREFAENADSILAVYEGTKEYEQLSKVIRQFNGQRKAMLRNEADTFLGNAIEWKDKAGWRYMRETMERNIRDIVPDPEQAQAIIDRYFTPVHQGEANAARMKEGYRARVKALNLSRKVEKGNAESEAHAVQLIGEAESNIQMLANSEEELRDGKTAAEWQEVIQKFWDANPNLDQKKIYGAIAEFRKIYEELYEQMNVVRARNGYEPIAHRAGYFPHFQPGESEGLLAMFGYAMGVGTDVDALPTTINGLTHQFRPGIQWFGNTMERLGFATAYDAVEGFDRYIEGAAGIVHQTDNIQRLRAFASQIRYNTSDEATREKVDEVRNDPNLDEETKNERIKEIYEKGKVALSSFVVELDEYINLLANKKSRWDRNMEQAARRRMYRCAKWLESRIAVNMVAINPGSWLTNFIPLTQGGAEIETELMLKAMRQTMEAYKKDDGFVNRSTFLTNRRGSDPLVKAASQKVTDTLAKPMEIIDYFTADTLVRARFMQNVRKGMSEEAAMMEADAWTAGVMADRSKGSTPTFFSAQNPIAKLFTQFQIEVNNQYSYLFKDIPRRHRGNMLRMVAVIGLRFVLGAFMYNEVYEKLVGRRSAFDILGIINETVGDLTGYELPNLVDVLTDAARGEGFRGFETKKENLANTAFNLGKNIAEEIPFVGGLFGGGRIPISSALPDLTKLGNAALNGDWSARKRWETLVREILDSGLYVLPPAGGSQISKALKGIEAVLRGGSYTTDAEGEDVLQYPVFNDSAAETAGNLVQGALFGKSAFEGSREWIESGFKSLSVKETAAYQGMLEVGVDGRDAYALIAAMRGIEKTEDESERSLKMQYLQESNVSGAGKFAYYYAVLASDDEREVMSSAVEDQNAEEIFENILAIRRAKEESGFKRAEAMQGAASAIGEENALRLYGKSAYERATDEQAEGVSVDDFYDLYFDGIADVDKGLKFLKAGMDKESAVVAARAIGRLEPEDGKASLSTVQKYRAICDADLTEGEKHMALEVVASDSDDKKLRVISEMGVDLENFVCAKENLSFLNKENTGTSSVSNAKVKAAVDAVEGITVEDRAVLWQLLTGSSSAKNNPYSVSVGWSVVEKNKGFKED